MKSFVFFASAAMAATLALAQPMPAQAASPQSRQDARHDRHAVKHNRREVRHDRHELRHDRRDERHDRRHERRHWARGERLRDHYRGPVYVVRDYRHYHLRRPPRGDHWVRDDSGNYLLVAITTGVITDLLLNSH